MRGWISRRGRGIAEESGREPGGGTGMRTSRWRKVGLALPGFPVRVGGLTVESYAAES